MIATQTEGFAIPPYTVKKVPIGWYVANAQGFNCLHFPDKPGAKFTTEEIAKEIANSWNK